MLRILLDCSWKPWTWGDCILDFVTTVLRETVEALILLIFEPILRLISDAVGSIVTTLGTFWLDPAFNVPITSNPDCTGGGSNPCGGASREVAFINDQLLPVTIAVATVSVIIAGARMAWSFRGEPARDLLRSLLTLLVVSSAGVSVIALLISAGDAFAESVLNAALDQSSFGERVSGFLVLSAATGNVGMLGLMIVLGILAVLASLFQIVLLLVRNGMLVLLVGVFPLAAAFTNTEMGRAWFRRIVTWIVAFLLYEPVAALIYATSIRLVGGDADTPAPWEAGGLDDIGQQIVKGITGLMMMFLALFALPALMRLTTPLVAATAGGQGFGQILGGVLTKQADKLAEGADTGGDGPSGAQNVGQSRPSTSRAPQQGPSGSRPAPSQQPPSQPSSPSPGPSSAPTPAPTPAPAAASGGGATAGASAGAGGGGAAAAGGGAAAAAGPAAVAVVAIQAAKKVAHTVKKAGEEAVAQGADDRAMDEGPSGSS